MKKCLLPKLALALILQECEMKAYSELSKWSCRRILTQGIPRRVQSPEMCSLNRAGSAGWPILLSADQSLLNLGLVFLSFSLAEHLIIVKQLAWWARKSSGSCTRKCLCIKGIIHRDMYRRFWRAYSKSPGLSSANDYWLSSGYLLEFIKCLKNDDKLFRQTWWD